jgi:gas vesicle protein
MRNLALGLIIGFVAGAVAGWLFVVATSVKPLREELDDVQKIAAAAESGASEFQQKYDGLQNASADREKELRGELEQNRTALDEYVKQVSTKDAYIAKLEERLRKASQEPPTEKTAAEPGETAKEQPSEEEELVKSIVELMKNVTPIGGPLNENAVKELGLDENQVAGINDVLKGEGERMHKRLADWAAGLLTKKTPEEIAAMSDLEISVAVMSYLKEDLDTLRKLPPEDQRAIQLGKKHFVNFLPKDSNLVRIARDLYEERRKTYESLASYIDEDEEKALKEKYFSTGTFIFPGGASYGIGPLSDEDFQEK